MGGPRFLWGKTRMDIVDMVPQAAEPPAKTGRMFVDADGHFNFCEDGTSFGLIRDVLHN